MHPTLCNMHEICNMKFYTCSFATYIQFASCNCNVQFATCKLQHAFCNKQFVTCYLQHAICNMQFATCYLQLQCIRGHVKDLMHKMQRVECPVISLGHLKVVNFLSRCQRGHWGLFKFSWLLLSVLCACNFTLYVWEIS